MRPLHAMVLHDENTVLHDENMPPDALHALPLPTCSPRLRIDEAKRLDSVHARVAQALSAAAAAEASELADDDDGSGAATASSGSTTVTVGSASV